MKFEAKDLEPAVPPPGRYRLKLLSSREGRSRAGNPLVSVTAVVLDGEHADNRVRDYFVVGGSPSASSIGRRKLAALFRATGVEISAGQEVDPRCLEEKVVCAQVDNEHYEGSRRARVLYYVEAANKTPF